MDLGNFDDSETIEAAKEIRRFSSWFARVVAVFVGGGDCKNSARPIGGIEQQSVHHFTKCITQRTTATSQRTFLEARCPINVSCPLAVVRCVMHLVKW